MESLKRVLELRLWLAAIFNKVQTVENRMQALALLKYAKGAIDKKIKELEPEARTAVETSPENEKGIRSVRMGDVEIRRHPDGNPQPTIDLAADKVVERMIESGVSPELANGCVRKVESVDIGRLLALVELGQLSEETLRSMIRMEPGRSGAVHVNPLGDLKKVMEEETPTLAKQLIRELEIEQLD